MFKQGCSLSLKALALAALMMVIAFPAASPGQREGKERKPKRDYGPEQAIGEPDTLDGGDHASAWAPLFPDAGEEWLVLDYATAVIPARVKIYENFNPGAVVKVTVFDASGKEIEAWKGMDPTSPDKAHGISEIALAAKTKTQRIKIYLDTKPAPDANRVEPPYNEIDAVGLVDAAGKTQWAVAASASSTNADAGGMAFAYGAYNQILSRMHQRLKILEEELAELRKEVQELKKKSK
jgi:hypothetical protein